MSTRKKYDDECRARAMRMVAEKLQNGSAPSEWAAIVEVSRLLDIKTPETLRRWIRAEQAPAAVGDAAGLADDVARLQRENAELRRANAILKAASAFFAAEIVPTA